MFFGFEGLSVLAHKERGLELLNTRDAEFYHYHLEDKSSRRHLEDLSSRVFYVVLVQSPPVHMLLFAPLNTQ